MLHCFLRLSAIPLSHISIFVQSHHYIELSVLDIPNPKLSFADIANEFIIAVHFPVL